MPRYILRVTLDELGTNKREVDFRVEVDDRDDIHNELRELGSQIESYDYPFRSDEEPCPCGCYLDENSR